MSVRAAVITVSTKGAAGERADESGPAMRERLVAAGFEYTRPSFPTTRSVSRQRFGKARDAAPTSC